MSDGYTDGNEQKPRSNATRSKLAESLRKTAEAEEKYENCPECGEDYVGLDTTMAGDLVFVHQNSPLKYCTLDSDTDQSDTHD